MGFSNKDDHRHVVDYETDMYTGITTFHGLVRIYNSKQWWSRIFWIVVSFLAMIGFFLQAESLVFLYNRRPTQTQVNFVAPKNGIEFPDITICNFNPVKMSKVEKWNMTNSTIEYVLMSYLQVENLYTQYNETTINDWHEDFQMYKTNYTENTGKKFDLREFFYETGYDCEEMIVSCMYAGMALTDCCNHSTPIMTDIGKCFKFQNFGNSSWLNRQMISGAFYGLHMLIDVMQDEYAGANSAGMLVENYMDAGVKFYVHPDGVLPFLSSMGTAIPPGRRGFGAITIRNISKYDRLRTERPLPLHKCLGNGRYPVKYETLRICCKTLTKDLPIAYFPETETYWYKSCQCGVECDRMEYNVEMSYSAIPSKASLYGLSKTYGKNSSYVLDNYLVLNVYMKEITYEKHQQQKSINRVTVLSDIGGNMGMFLGMSVITLGEIFLFFVKGLWGIFNKKRREQIEARERSSSTQTDPYSEDEYMVHSKKSFIKPLANSGNGFAGSDSYSTVYAGNDTNLPAGTQASKVRAYSGGRNTGLEIT